MYIVTASVKRAKCNVICKWCKEIASSTECVYIQSTLLKHLVATVLVNCKPDGTQDLRNVQRSMFITYIRHHLRTFLDSLRIVTEELEYAHLEVRVYLSSMITASFLSFRLLTTPNDLGVLATESQQSIHFRNLRNEVYSPISSCNAGKSNFLSEIFGATLLGFQTYNAIYIIP